MVSSEDPTQVLSASGGPALAPREPRAGGPGSPPRPPLRRTGGGGGGGWGDEPDGPGGSGRNPLLVVIAVALVLIVLILAFVALKGGGDDGKTGSAAREQVTVQPLDTPQAQETAPAETPEATTATTPSAGSGGGSDSGSGGGSASSGSSSGGATLGGSGSSNGGATVGGADAGGTDNAGDEDVPTLTGGSVTKITVNKGDTVAFKVTADTAQEVHVHGYDKKYELSAGETKTISFPATITGIFEIEFEGTSTQIGELTVEP